MSLILEALKKLEREKDTPDRGFLVVAQVPWVGEGRRGKALPALGLVAVIAVAGAIVLWRRSDRPTAPAAAGPPVTAPSAPTPDPLPVSPPLRAEVVPIAPRYLPPSQPLAFPVRPRGAAPRTVPRSTAAPPALAPATKAPASPASADGSAALRLEAVSEQDGMAVAVINGQLVREGDHVLGALVVRIGAQEVEVEVDGRRSVLRF